jgi:hypothetical protein
VARRDNGKTVEGVCFFRTAWRIREHGSVETERADLASGLGKGWSRRGSAQAGAAGESGVPACAFAAVSRRKRDDGIEFASGLNPLQGV